MNRPTPQELIDTKMSSLSAPVRDTLTSPETTAILESIAEEFNLDEQQAYTLLDEIAYTLFGISTIEELKENIIENLDVRENVASSIAVKVNSLIFAPIKKFLRTKKEVYLSVNSKETKEAGELVPSVDTSDDLNHHDILNEIESPTPSIADQSYDKPIEHLQTMPKEAQAAMQASENKDDDSQLIKAPTLQEAVGNMPDIGGFIPVNNVLAPSQKVANTLDSKLSTATATPIKEVFIPKKIDPYREPAE